MAIFLALVYIRGLTWDFSSEVYSQEKLATQTNRLKFSNNNVFSVNLEVVETL
jgi:hypothetical protein